MGKHSHNVVDFRCSKKKFRFDFESSLDVKVDFWSQSNETLFHSFKDKILVHGRIVDLNLLLSLHCLIKPFFEFQGWENLFSTTPKVFSEPLIFLFYANLRSSKHDEFETLVHGKRIFLDYAIFHINCIGFSTPSKNSWPSNSGVSFEKAKKLLVLDSSIPVLSQLGTKDLYFEN